MSGDKIVVFRNSAMDVQDGNPVLVALDRDALFIDEFEVVD